MSKTRLIPEKITSPIQLMAAWFVMQVLTISVLLTAASQINHPSWASGTLVISSILTILIVIGCVFVMLTKYRPHLQEGKEYAEWLKDQNRYVTKKEMEDIQIPEFIKKAEPDNQITPFKIYLSNIEGRTELVDNLRTKGYDAELYEKIFEEIKLDDPKRHESIWIGSRVYPDYAVEVIKLAIKIWPHLKYLHLSNDGTVPPDEVHDQMFLGGSTETAKRYGCIEWSKSEINSLKKNMSYADFHKIIRDKYAF